MGRGKQQVVVAQAVRGSLVGGKSSLGWGSWGRTVYSDQIGHQTSDTCSL